MKFVAGLCPNGYELHISEEKVLIGVLGPRNGFMLYQAATVSDPPGIVTLVYASVEDGTLSVPEATVSGGTLYAASTYTVRGGTLYSGRTAIWMKDLADYLAELGEGEVYYIRREEVCYAIDASCLTVDGDEYTLYGYPMSAVGTSESKPVAGMWTGLAGGEELFLAACDGVIWSLLDAETGEFTRDIISDQYTVGSNGTVTFFPFDNKVYIMDGEEFYVYGKDGNATFQFGVVGGYAPLIAIGIGPIDSGQSGETTGEYVNLLSRQRRVQLSPDGTHKTFRLPEKGSGLTVDSVVFLETGATVSAYTTYPEEGTITFTDAPDEGDNTYEVTYTIPSTDATAELRRQVTSNLFAEIFSGNTDQGVFFYGNGTNRIVYSGMDSDGLARADYFPDQYSVDVGDSNTPITGLIRHHGALMCFKTDSAWALTYGTTQLANGNSTIAIYCTPINKDKGNIVPGQVQLVNNNPITCSGTELYQWRSVSRYSSAIGRDERNAIRITDRVQESIKELSIPSVCMWDDNDNQEFYLVGNSIALVWNYVTDAWYRYETFDAVRMCNFHGEVYIGAADGRIRRLTDEAIGDEGLPIHAKWVSGAMDFGVGYMRKYSSMLWVGLKPVEGTSVDVCLETDRKNTFKEKVVSSAKAKIAGQPFMSKIKLKAKKFVYYRLILSVDEKMPSTTVTDIEIRVRSTGYAK